MVKKNTAPGRLNNNKRRHTSNSSNIQQGNRTRSTQKIFTEYAYYRYGIVPNAVQLANPACLCTKSAYMYRGLLMIPLWINFCGRVQKSKKKELLVMRELHANQRSPVLVQHNVLANSNNTVSWYKRSNHKTTTNHQHAFNPKNRSRPRNDFVGKMTVRSAEAAQTYNDTTWIQVGQKTK